MRRDFQSMDRVLVRRIPGLRENPGSSSRNRYPPFGARHNLCNAPIKLLLLRNIIESDWIEHFRLNWRRWRSSATSKKETPPSWDLDWSSALTGSHPIREDILQG
jgi:hypothetical protein